MDTVISAAELQRRLEKLPRLKLATLPTPLEELPRLAGVLGGPRLWVKREDLTGLALGGNKIREFEYQFAQAVEMGCDVLVHGAAAQSNQSRVTAAAAAKLGLKAVIVGRHDAHAQLQGNLLLSHLFGAEVHLSEAKDQAKAIQAKMVELQDQGYTPFNTSSDAAIYRSIAYVDGFLELWDQCQTQGVRPDAIYLCSGAHTHIGMVLGAKALGVKLRVVGISPSPRDDAQAAIDLAKRAAVSAAVLGLDVKLGPEDFESYAEFVGADYGIVTDGSRQAIQLAAQHEGLLLDPCYTGKTMAGLHVHIQKGWWHQDQTVLFVHTGGIPALFAYNQELGLA